MKGRPITDKEFEKLLEAVPRSPGFPQQSSLFGTFFAACGCPA